MTNKQNSILILMLISIIFLSLEKIKLLFEINRLNNNQENLLKEHESFKDKNIKFLSLIKMKECFVINLLNKIKFKSKINKIRDTYPYYTSLQITLWDIEY